MVIARTVCSKRGRHIWKLSHLWLFLNPSSLSGAKCWDVFSKYIERAVWNEKRSAINWRQPWKSFTETLYTLSLFFSLSRRQLISYEESCIQDSIFKNWGVIILPSNQNGTEFCYYKRRVRRGWKPQDINTVATLGTVSRPRWWHQINPDTDRKNTDFGRNWGKPSQRENNNF